MIAQENSKPSLNMRVLLRATRSSIQKSVSRLRNGVVWGEVRRRRHNRWFGRRLGSGMVALTHMKLQKQSHSDYTFHQAPFTDTKFNNATHPEVQSADSIQYTHIHSLSMISLRLCQVIVSEHPRDDPEVLEKHAKVCIRVIALVMVFATQLD